ncbi:DEAD/DEAH box helicase [Paenibacillus sp. N3/727]|uniref:DEAD/DEAH box helicase n=1 Tax=Paenibacillus sp. N3/727 TaxID=2925845 RepID=UPI001F532C70|nr:helicase-related protein [Paenibacillus sp. N3/727]UNK18078.1 DEAD/DEAH box helicase [Paenibacillus sp. N3/727]
MQAALYAVRSMGSWSIEISLDVRVDVQWWLNMQLAERLVLLAWSLPLGWAVSLRERFRGNRVMDRWGLNEWRKYVLQSLAVHLAAEPQGQGEQLIGKADDMVMWTSGQIAGINTGFEDAMVWDRLLMQAEELGELLQGRALLAGEVEALLEEASDCVKPPERGVAPHDAARPQAGADLSAGWLAAAQLGCLLGRLRLDAGLAQPAPWEKPGWLRRSRAMALRCRRCGSEALSRTACATCGSAACAYCEACLAMGRSRSCALLLQGAAHPAVRGTAGGSPTEALVRWGLSAAQGVAAGAALRFLAEPPEAGSAAARFLIWAVTGAGKTEMIFPLLQAVLDGGGRVLVAAPRRDVVLELAPRLATAFPSESIVTLYGGSPDRWKRGSITLATTHQLLRFRHAFDLVVIDEIDAFPYHNDPMLDYAANGACKPGGKYIYLSATPPSKLQREAAAGRLPHAKVPARFHGHPLPVPKPLKIPSVQRCLTQKSLPSSLVRELKTSISRGAQVFLFVSRIRHIDSFLQLLRRYFSEITIEGTSSVDPDRGNKVMSFRNRDIRLLVTTTILERGVTVPKSDVFIVDADSDLFDEAALIQMAGRAGRSKDDPAGKVVFGSPQWTRSQRSAVNQIKRMNRIARKGNYLKV